LGAFETGFFAAVEVEFEGVGEGDVVVED